MLPCQYTLPNPNISYSCVLARVCWVLEPFNIHISVYWYMGTLVFENLSSLVHNVLSRTFPVGGYLCRSLIEGLYTL